MLDNKKLGQVSMFIVIGVILVIVASFLIYNNSFQLFISKDSKLKNQVTQTVQDCINQYANTGVFQLGFQGGYINIPQSIALNPQSYTDFGLKIPNWDSERGNIPTISSMQTELENYIDDNAMSCIKGNLQALNEFLTIDINNSIQTQVTINDNNIILESHLPIKFKETNSDNTLEVEDYYVKLDSTRLGDLYNLATQIYNLEGSSNFMEDLVIDQIYSSSDYSDPNSLPSEGMFFSCSPRIWTLERLKSNLANLNNNNFKYLYFDGTYPIDDVYDANLNKELGTYNLRDYFKSNYQFQLPNAKSSFKNYKVQMLMPSTEITGNNGILSRYPFRTFEVTPSSGGVTKAMDFKIDAGAKIPIPCIQIFHHLYTLDYDLIVKLTDYNSDGNLYTFQFPLRVEVKNNNPKTIAYSPITNTQPLTATNEAFCSDDSKQFPLRIYAKDIQGNFLSDVNISYKCISLTCDLGQTAKPTFQGIVRQYAQPYYEGNFPFCVGGQVIAEKSGYNKGKVRVDTTQDLLNTDKTTYYDVSLTLLKTFTAEVGTFLVVDKDTKKGSRVRTEKDGTIMVTVENKGQDFESQLIWPNDGTYYNKLELLDDDNALYNLTIYYSDANYSLRGYINQENIHINANTGNELSIVIPASSKAVGEDEYANFIDYTNRALESGDYGLFIR